VEVIELRKTGPFTRDPALVKLLLDPATVKLSLKEFYDEFMGFIKQGMRRSGIRDPRALSVAKIARALAGRPAVAGGTTTAYRVLPPRLNCDTKSHADGVTLNDWFKQECGAADPVSEQIANVCAASTAGAGRPVRPDRQQDGRRGHHRARRRAVDANHVQREAPAPHSLQGDHPGGRRLSPDRALQLRRSAPHGRTSRHIRFAPVTTRRRARSCRRERGLSRL